MRILSTAIDKYKIFRQCGLDDAGSVLDSLISLEGL